MQRSSWVVWAVEQPPSAVGTAMLSWRRIFDAVKIPMRHRHYHQSGLFSVITKIFDTRLLSQSTSGALLFLLTCLIATSKGWYGIAQVVPSPRQEKNFAALTARCVVELGIR